MIGRAGRDRRGGRDGGTALRRRLGGLLDDLGVDPPLTPQRLCDRLAQHRGRPIELVSWALPPDAVSGFLIVYEHKDVIVYQSRTSTLHQAHIVFHEIGHLVLDHVGGCGPAAVPPDTGPPAAGSSLYDEREEWEAETAATILSSWTEPGLAGLTGADPAGTDASSRLGAALGLPRPWR